MRTIRQCPRSGLIKRGPFKHRMYQEVKPSHEPLNGLHDICLRLMGIKVPKKMCI